MSINNRIYYPIQALAFANHGVNFATNPTGYTAAHGLQSVGSNVTFNLEQVFELGQIEIYEQIENIPNVELTASKVIDGYPLLQHLASRSPQGSTLNARYNNARTNVILTVYNESQNAASGVPLAVTLCSGMYLSSINFNIPVNGNAEESVTLVGNNKVRTTGSIPTGLFDVGSRFNNADSPIGTGGVQRRENVNFALSRLPIDLPGISSSGTNDYVNGAYNCHVQNVSVAVNLGRTELFELGRRGPYNRYIEFPTEVTCSIEMTTDERDDGINAYEEQNNVTNQTIKFVLDCGVVIDLGNKNVLQSVSRSGGDATGGNATTTYNYSNFNSLTVTYPGYDYL